MLINKKCTRWLLAWIMVAGFVFMVSAPVSAAGGDKTTAPAKQTDTVFKGLDTDPAKHFNGSVVTTRILKKFPDSILTEIRRFNAHEETYIVDTKNKFIPLSKLKVPCEAEIMFKPAHSGNPLAILIKVKQNLSGAKSSWSKPRQEDGTE